MLVTIYTDASVSDDMIGYAYRCKSKLGRIESGGALKSKISVNQAEHLAIREAIKHTIKKWPKTKVLFINTDSLSCCKTYWFLGKIKRNGASHDLIDDAKVVHDWCESNGYKLRLKHVKGHMGNSNVRYYLNNYCDNAASNNRIILTKNLLKTN